MATWLVETELELKNGNRLTHRCEVEADDEASAIKSAKRAWNRDIRFGRGSFTYRASKNTDPTDAA
ncbi:MAG: hypothetical protein AAF501_10075 [Pseudomonadota bacterium]